MKQKVYIGIGERGRVETLAKLVIEDHNRDEVKEIFSDFIDMIYDGLDEEEGENGEL